MENIRSFENKAEQKILTFETTDSRGWTGKTVFAIDPRWKRIAVTAACLKTPIDRGVVYNTIIKSIE